MICKGCEREFELTNGRSQARRRYCSPACVYEAQLGHKRKWWNQKGQAERRRRLLASGVTIRPYRKSSDFWAEAALAR